MDIEQKKAQLLAALQSQSDDDSMPDDSLTVLDRAAGSSLPLSFAQEQLWTINEMQPPSPVYTIPTAVRLAGSVNVANLNAAFDHVIQRHESLRTNFRSTDDGAVAIVRNRPAFEVERDDLEGADESRVDQEIADFVSRPFDLTNDRLIRASLMRISRDDHVLAICVHHIISDGWSTSILLRELGECYSSLTNNSGSDAISLPELSIQAADFSAWQRHHQGTKEADDSLSFWVEKLSGPLPVSDLPTDRPRPPQATTDGDYLQRTLPQSLSSALKTLAQDNDVTPFVLFHSAFALLLHKYTGKNDVIVGTPMNNRDRQDLEGLIGFFINTLMLRSSIDPTSSFREHLSTSRAEMLQSLDHKDTPLPTLIESIDVERDLSYNPGFQVMFAFQNVPDAELNFAGLDATLIPDERIHTRSSKVDISLVVKERHGRFTIAAEYNTNLFDSRTIASFLRHFEVLLESVKADPTSPIRDIRCIDNSEFDLLIRDLNDTGVDSDIDVSVYELFASAAETFPDNTAVVAGKLSLSYRELSESVESLAGVLAQNGVSAGDTVGVCMQRSPGYVTSLLAILRVGAAYLAIDPKTPEERLNFMLEDSGAACLMHDSSVADRCGNFAVVGIDPHSIDELQAGKWTAPSSYDCNSNAYVIYTSGSTGKPKGVAIRHRALANLVRWHQRSYDLTSDDRATSLAGLGFDASVWELWPYLTCGASIYLSDDETRLSPAELMRWYDDNRITVSFLPTPLAEAALHESLPTGLSLRYLLTGGDKLRTRPAHDLSFKLINHYGPTENTVVSTAGEVFPGGAEDSAPSIGRPIDNTRAYILDDDLNPVPKGARGQLYVSGVGLAVGYVNRDDLTSRKFLPNPYGDGDYAMLYATGDMVRYSTDNQIEFLERRDFQVKIRGMRVELGEIESALISHDEVSQCIVTTAPVSKTSQESKLVGFYEVKSGSNAADTDLRTFLARTLPDYMVPADLVRVDAFQLTPSGKIDRRALPIPASRTESSRSLRTAETPTQEYLVKVWAECLELRPSKLSVDDNFFHIGGHSLVATRVIAKVNDKYSTDLPLASLFELPTIELLSASIDRRIVELTSPLLGIQSARRETQVPATHTQRRLWYLSQLEPGNSEYNVPIGIEFTGPVVFDTLEQALQLVIDKHDALRTTFQIDGAELLQYVHGSVRFELDLIDVSSAGQDEVRDLVSGCGELEFCLDTGPLVRFTLLKLSDNKHLLVIVAHHIVFDGWSSRVFLDDLYSAYQSLLEDSRFELEKPDLQFADYAYWQEHWISHGGIDDQVAVWLRRFEGHLPTLDMPTQLPRPNIRSSQGAQVTLPLDADLAARVYENCRQSGVTFYIFMLSVYYCLLSRYTQQNDFVIGTPVANRQALQSESMVGCFINTLALRVQIAPDDRFADVLQRVKVVCTEAFKNQDMPFAKLVEELQPPRDASRTPVYQTMFSVFEHSSRREVTPGLWAAVRPPVSTVAKTDLTLSVDITDDDHQVQLEYSTSLFTEEFANELLLNYETLLINCLDDMNSSVATVDAVNAASRATMLSDWNETSIDYDDCVLLRQMFDKAVAADPHKIAVISNGREFSYANIQQRAHQLAALLRGAGAKQHDIVGICLDRSENLIVAILACFEIGAAYLPLDPEYPPQRIRYIVEDAGVAHILVESQYANLFEDSAATLVDVDDMPADSGSSTTHQAPVAAGPDDIAYVIYTSGSTGKPKGVSVTQRNLANFVLIMGDHPGMDVDDRALAITTLSFDISVAELLAPMAYGATTVIANRDEVLDPGRLGAMLDIYDITYAQGTPSAWQAVLASGWAGKDDLRLGVIGEALSTDLASRLCENTGEFWNLYGPTETTIHSSAYRLDNPESEPLIGRPVANTELYVLDPNRQLLPVGVPGELYIGGDGVTNGYLGKPELTAEQFVANPYSDNPDDRIYRTGDKVLYRMDGNLEFLGRFDTQVKVRGFRIELGEIESVVNALDEIERSVAIVREDRPGDLRIVIYYVATDGHEVETTLVRKHVRQLLPGYMVPQHFVLLDEFPLTPNAKVDRLALPAPSGLSMDTDTRIAPRTDTEKALAIIWQDVLGIDAVHVHDNFFDLGGHSLLSFEVIARVHEQMGVKMMLRPLIMDNLEQIAARIEADNGTDAPEQAAGRSIAGKLADMLVGTSAEEEKRQ